MIKVSDFKFVIETNTTSYCFRKLNSGQLEHLYYGEKMDAFDGAFEALCPVNKYPAGNLCTYSKDFPDVALENMCLEYSGYGKGDVREPLVVIRNTDGSLTSDFIYHSYVINRGEHIESINGMPSALKPDEQLKIKLMDRQTNVELDLYYNIFEESDCITRFSKVVNHEDSPIEIVRLLSNQLDIFEGSFEFMNFTGAWAREMNVNTTPVFQGKLVNSSVAGVSSNRNNPFTILKKSDTNEFAGDCFGFNLIYSGNHYTCVSKDGFGKVRVVSGINPDCFSFKLNSNEAFFSPEAVMSYSGNGLNGLSKNMHTFVRKHIVRGKWAGKSRPVLLNSWEASYFKIDEKKLIDMAKTAKKLGIELLVVDDGWFGKRDNDKSSLGDWDTNLKKLPGGLKGICDKINGLGLDFGIWIEPEMVSVDSDLYRKHPDYAVCVPGKDHSEGRNQRFLDFTKKEVRDYIVDKICNVLSSANISYVKWDMNRIFTDFYSDSLDNQMEFSHRYILGLYDVIERITGAFPDILFEGCASGGNRFDLGILCYMPQIWASDNTDAWCRAAIQTGLSYGYPMSVVSSHISGCPNHQTLRNTLLETRFNVAFMANLGYEINVSDLSSEMMNEIKAQIKLYKENRDVLFDSDFIRMSYGDNYEWMLVSRDKSKAFVITLSGLSKANYPDCEVKLTGLCDDKLYHFYNIPAKYDIHHFGDLINIVSPVHIRQNSLVHNAVSKFVKMDGETEDIVAKGSVLNKCGVRTHKNFAGTGYDSDVRFYQDFGSRLYFIEEAKND